MFKKMLPWLIIVLIAITLIVSAAVILWNFLDRASADPGRQAAKSVESVKAEQMSAKEISDLTVKMDDITTNLSNDQFIKIGFAFELENSKAKDEFSLLDFKVKSIIIQTLADLAPDQIKGSKGIDYLSTTLMNKINTILTDGKVTHVDVTSLVLT